MTRRLSLERVTMKPRGENNMRIQINEVWNDSGKSVELAIIEPVGSPFLAVQTWIATNRPDLECAMSIYAHGFHAVEVA